MKSDQPDRVLDTGFLNGGNMNYLESLYQDTRSGNGQDPDLAAWREVFAGLSPQIPAAPVVSDQGSSNFVASAERKQANVSKLIMAYRALGHLLADRRRPHWGHAPRRCPGN